MSELFRSISELSLEQRAVLERQLQQRRSRARSATAIGRRRDPGAHPLSFAQQRIWFLEQLAPGSPLYVVPIAVRLRGQLVPAALESSFAEILRRHETLRASFTNDRGRPVQRIGPVREPVMAGVDLAGLPEAVRAAEALRIAAEESLRPLLLTGAGLLRVLLVRIAARDHLLLVSMSHIASDGWSTGVLLREMAALYQAALRGASSPLPALPIQYADFAQWQREWLSGAVLERQLAYWRDRLADAPAMLDLPTDLPRPAAQTFRGAAEPLFVDGGLVARLRALAQAGEATLFMVLVAGWSALLSRYSGQTDLLVGTPVANRQRVETEGLIGFFVNTLVLRTDLAGDPGMFELLERVREQTLPAYAHQDLPFEKLVEELAPERSLAHSPLFQVMIALQNAPLPDLRLPGLALEVLRPPSRTSKFDLTLSLAEAGGGLSGVIEYNTDLFSAATIRRMCGHFENVLRALAARPGVRLQELPILGEAERRQVLLEWNDTGAAYPAGVCLHELFELQVQRTPDAAAVVAGDEWLTYGELDARANQMAHHLRRLGVGADVPVALVLERSADLVIALLGVLKAGGAYLPVDPAYPEERRLYMVESSRTPVLVTRSRLGSSPGRSRVAVVDLDTAWERIAAESTADPVRSVAPGHLAYVLYTSGSTGRPKGAMISHAAICNHMTWMQEALPLGTADSVLQKTPFSFDASVWEFWAPLLVGARLIMARPGGHQDPAYLGDEIQRHGITTFQVVPTLLKLFLQEPRAAGCTCLRRVYCGGEALSIELAERFSAVLPAAELLNVYGPTEASIHATFWSSRRGEIRRSVPIGRPIANARVYLLDRGMEPVPAGVPGLLFVGGAGLGRGYLARPEMTAAAFVPDPWTGTPGERLYLTGDLARHLPDGNIEFLGRVDSQVKVRGFRIELGEIEAVLAAHPALREVVVVTRRDASGEHRLAAYAVAREGREPQVQELRAYLKERLPEHMVPADFVLLAAFPLLPNGKLDRRSLPQPARAERDAAAGRAPLRSPVEELIAGVWSELLGIGEVGEDDNFFELGGHSLLAAQVLSRVRETLGIELPLRTVFEAPTVGELARRVERARRATPSSELLPLVPLPREGVLPASYAQERLWFFDQLQPGNPAYNLAFAMSLKGDLDLAALGAALQEEVRRQESLRTAFPAVDGRPVSVVSRPVPRALPLVDLAALPPGPRAGEAARLLAAESRRSFDLARGPLWRAAVLRLGRREHVLSLTVHHIVSDGWSSGLLVRETAALYQAFAAGRPSPLPELALQYVDYARWQRAWLAGAPLAAQLAAWTARLAGAPALSSLPTDRPRPAVGTFRGLHRQLVLPSRIGPALTALGRRLGLTQHMILLAAFAALLHRASGQEDLCIGTPVANRNHPAVEGLVGLFVNTLVLRVGLANDPTAGELLARVRETALGAYDQQELPFELLVEALDLRRDLSHNPLFQTMLTVQNAPVAPLDVPGLRFEPLALEPGGARFDLTLEMGETDGLLGGWIEYNVDLFDAATIERLVGHFVVLLGGLLDDPGRRVAELPLLTEAELHQLVCGWNDTAAPFPGDVPVSRLFEPVAARHPSAPAVVCGDGMLTYGELNRQANQLARHLRALGVGAETIVGVHLPRSAGMVVALLAIWKAGGAYLPLDPSYPAERIALMLEDSRAAVVIAREPLDGRLAGYGGTVVDLDAAADAVGRYSGDDLATAAESRNLAYVIYTSGSTGRPKGVMVPHRGVASFFTGMDARIGRGTPGGWLAVTSISFDISVLELFWPLCRGSAVVLQKEQSSLLTDLGSRPRAAGREREISFSLFFFASDEDQEEGMDRYRLLLEAARFADRHGFAAVWTPERHFHKFGGLYPNPVVTSAAIAAITERVEVRAGSVVLPLHNPIRVAEEWAVVDNISRGRAGISFASGWHAGDFVLAPERFARRKEVMFEGIETVRKLWRGDEIEVPGVDGRPVGVRIRPRPVRSDLPVWVTAAGNPETFRKAGEIGAHVLTHLLGQSLEELAPMIALYRSAWRAHPDRAGEGQVTLMLHTFVDPDMETVRSTVRAPFRTYLESSVSLLRSLASSLGRDMDAAGFTAEDMEALLDHAGDRYFETSSLFGTPESCRSMVERLRAIDVDEVACLIDFGIATDRVLASLAHLDAVRRQSAAGRGAAAAPAISHLQCTPSLARMLSTDEAALAALGSVPTLMVGGEALSSELAARLTATVRGQVHNMYGPTETTIWSATHALGIDERPVSIGRPIVNTSIHLLGRAGSPVPIGVPGELLIGGEGVVRGYLGRPDLTAARFVPDPFAAVPGARLYRTGDLARFLPDGRLEFLGRTDQQMKIRGFRIEPGEIEAALELHPEVRSAAVVPRQDGAAESRLVAYFVAVREDGRPGAADLRRFLADRLPDFMVPAAFVQLAALPLTPNGKLDRGALPAPGPEQHDPERAFAAPQNPVQELVAGLFAELLDRQRVGIHESFFELGGHSLLATRLVARLRQVLRVGLPLRAVFEAPTIALLARRAEQMQREQEGTLLPPLAPVPRQDHHPLSFAQQRIWFLEQMEPGGAAYHDRVAFRLEGPLQGAALARGFEEVVRRHEGLRTAFSTVSGRPVQAVSPVPRVTLQVVDLRGVPAAGREPAALREGGALARQPFDLGSGALFRMVLFRLGDEDHVLFLAVHHIIWDGWSLGVFLRELLASYEAALAGRPAPLPPLSVQYIDYSHWQRQWLQGELLENHLAYWKRRLGRGGPAWELPTDRPRQAERSHRGRRLRQVLDAGFSAELKALGRRSGTTLFMTLLAGFKALLSQAAGGDDIVVGTDLANRDRVETEPLIGFFVNQLVLRTSLSGDPSFAELLDRVRETALEAYAHQDVPFDRLVDALQWDRSLAQTPLFQVKFVLQNAPLPTEGPAGLRLRPFEAGWETAKFDLLLNMVDSGETLEGIWEYNTDLFDAATIVSLQEKLELVLRLATARPEARLSEIAQAMSERDRERRAGQRRDRFRSNQDKLILTKRRALAGAEARRGNTRGMQ